MGDHENENENQNRMSLSYGYGMGDFSENSESDYYDNTSSENSMDDNISITSTKD